MEKKDWPAKNFEESRNYLKAIAYRMLGSINEAEDAVQEAWMRLNRSESEEIENLKGWLTTVVSRICLDVLRSRKLRNEKQHSRSRSEIILNSESGNPEADLILADSIGPALLIVLDTLTPTERIAFVLHDFFDLSFKEIAQMLDRTEEATRQLTSRARRRVKGVSTPEEENIERQQEVVSAFLAASRNGNFEALIKILHPDVILRADETAVKIAQANKSRGAPQFESEITGAKTVAEIFKGKAAAAQLALIDGVLGATWASGGKPVVAFSFSVQGNKISAIEIVMDQAKLSEIDIEIINNKNAE